MKKYIGYLVLIAIALAVVVGVSLVALLKPPRGSYREIDFENDPWMAGFSSDYEQAVARADEWVKDPEAVALRVAGYTDDNQIPPEKVDMERTLGGKVIVTILSQSMEDDAVLRQETRVELVRNGAIWEIEWAGLRQQCRRGGSGSDWSTELCP